MDRTTKLRWLAVTVGLLLTSATLRAVSSIPQEEVDIFPTGVLLLGSMALAMLVVLGGMLYEFRKGSAGPLVAGTLGCLILLYLARVEHGATPNWPLVVGVVAVVLVPPLARMVVQLVFKR